MSLWEHIGSVPLTEGHHKIVRSGSTPRGMKQGEVFTRRSPIPTSSLFQRASRAAIGVIVLALLAVLVFSAATSHAQTTAVCDNSPGAGERIECIEDATSTSDIDTSGMEEPGVHAKHEGTGIIDIHVSADVSGEQPVRSTIDTTGTRANGIHGEHTGTGDIGLDVRMTDTV